MYSSSYVGSKKGYAVIRVQIDQANACCGKKQPNNLANLPKYVVQGRGATKPPAPESPRTASLKPTLVFSVLPLYTVLLFCVAIAARAPFEGVTTLILTEHACSSIMGGEGPTSRIVTAVLLKRSQNTKKHL